MRAVRGVSATALVRGAAQVAGRAREAAEAREAGTGRMLAWRVHGYGGPAELRLEEARVPPLRAPDEVLVRVRAASINPLDVAMLGGYGARLLNAARALEGAEGEEFPLVPGRDFVGDVCRAGPAAAARELLGRRVWGALPPYRPGAHQQYALARAAWVCEAPDALSDVEAGGVPYAALSACAALRAAGVQRREPGAGPRVLLLGLGGVGHAALQLLVHRGAQVPRRGGLRGAGRRGGGGRGGARVAVRPLRDAVTAAATRSGRARRGGRAGGCGGRAAAAERGGGAHSPRRPAAAARALGVLRALPGRPAGAAAARRRGPVRGGGGARVPVARGARRVRARGGRARARQAAARLHRARTRVTPTPAAQRTACKRPHWAGRPLATPRRNRAHCITPR